MKNPPMAMAVAIITGSIDNIIVFFVCPALYLFIPVFKHHVPRNINAGDGDIEYILNIMKIQNNILLFNESSATKP